jgi:hypothetical protein
LTLFLLWRLSYTFSRQKVNIPICEDLHQWLILTEIKDSGQKKKKAAQKQPVRQSYLT